MSNATQASVPVYRHGEIAPELLAEEVEFAVGDNKFATIWRNRKRTRGDLINAFTGYQVGPKEGQAVLQGALVKDNGSFDPEPVPPDPKWKKKSDRNNRNVRANYQINLDYETGVPIATFVEQMKRHKLLAVVHTTHSHLRPTSKVSKSENGEWMKRKGRAGEPTLADIVEYLREVKKYTAEVLVGAELLQSTDAEYNVKHQPMPRARVVLFLKKPHLFNGPDAAAEWKRLYVWAAEKCGFVYDKSCTDPARLMYTPRHAPDADPTKHEVHVIAGELLDADTMPKPEPKAKPEAKAKKAAAATPGDNKPSKAKAASADWRPANFDRFLGIGAGSFRAHEWLKSIDPEGIRGDDYPEAEAKHDHRCPREDAHSTGDTTDRAFMVRNGLPDGNGFGMSCRHAGCIAYATRPDGKEDRAKFLALLCQQHGITDAEDLIEWCSEEAQAKWNARPLLFLPDHMNSAREFLTRCRTVDGVPTIRRYQSQWWVWNGRKYGVADNEAVDGEVRRFLAECEHRNKEDERVRVCPNNELLANVLQSLRALPGVRVDDKVDMPTWLTGLFDEPRPPANELLACDNGVLHLKTRKLLPHSPLFFSPTCLPYAYNPQAPEPVLWKRCLREWFNGDEGSIRFLQTWFWLHLKGCTRHHKALYIQGPRRGGKGTIIEMLSAMLGEENVAAPLLETFGDKFGLEDLVGKRAAIVADARLSDRAPMTKIVTRLLGITANDRMRVDRKNIKAVASIKLNLLLTICSNDPLELPDASGAFPGRFHVLQTLQSFYGREDKTLKDRLAAELPGILVWSLEGMALDDTVGLVQPEASAGAASEMEDRSAPVGAFVRDACDKGPELSVERTALLEAYNEWAQERGYETLNPYVFGRELRRVILIGRRGRTRDRDRTYSGLALKQPRPAGTSFGTWDATPAAKPAAPPAAVPTPSGLPRPIPVVVDPVKKAQMDALLARIKAQRAAKAAANAKPAGTRLN